MGRQMGPIRPAWRSVSCPCSGRGRRHRARKPAPPALSASTRKSVARCVPSYHYLPEAASSRPRFQKRLEKTLRPALNLPYGFLRDSELRGELTHGRLLASVQTVAVHEHVAFALRQTPHGLIEPEALYRVEVLRFRVFHEVSISVGARLGAEGLVEARDLGYGLENEPDLARLPSEVGCGLLRGRLAVQHRYQLTLSFANLAEFLVHVGREPYLAPLVPEGALDRLADPPRRVRREAIALLGVELLYRLHQSDVALLDQVLQGKALPTVLPGHGDGQPQVLLHEPPAGLSVARSDPAAELHLFFVAEQLAPAYARHVGRKKPRSLSLPVDTRMSRQLSSFWCVISAL